MRSTPMPCRPTRSTNYATQRHRGPAVDRARRRAGLCLRLRSLMPPASRSTRRHSPPRGLGLEDVRNALVDGDGQPAEGRDRGRASGDRARHQRSAVQRRAIRQRHHRLQERRAGAHQGCRRRHQLGAERSDLRSWFGDQPAEGIAIQKAARRQHDRTWSTASKR